MQVNTGQLRQFENSQEMQDFYRTMEADERDNWEEVPEHLGVAAKKKLDGKKTAMVSKTSGGKLSRWAGW